MALLMLSCVEYHVFSEARCCWHRDRKCTLCSRGPDTPACPPGVKTAHLIRCFKVPNATPRDQVVTVAQHFAITAILWSPRWPRTGQSGGQEAKLDYNLYLLAAQTCPSGWLESKLCTRFCPGRPGRARYAWAEVCMQLYLLWEDQGAQPEVLLALPIVPNGHKSWAVWHLNLCGQICKIWLTFFVQLLVPFGSLLGELMDPFLPIGNFGALCEAPSTRTPQIKYAFQWLGTWCL